MNNKIKKLSFLSSALLLSFVLTSCVSARGPVTHTLDEPAPGMAKIYIYRVPRFLGKLLSYKVVSEDMRSNQKTIVGGLRNNGWFSYDTAPDIDYKLSFTSWGEVWTFIKPPADKITCVKFDPRADDAVYFKEVDIETCKADFKRFKLRRSY